MSEPKLLTEAEWQRISAPLGLTSTIDQIANALRERGLIAPEPVDPLLEEAREIVSKAYNWSPRTFENDHPAVVSTLAALRRGMELQREAAPLTREALVEAFKSLGWYFAEVSTDRLHAALTEQVRK